MPVSSVLKYYGTLRDLIRGDRYLIIWLGTINLKKKRYK